MSCCCFRLNHVNLVLSVLSSSISMYTSTNFNMYQNKRKPPAPSAMSRKRKPPVPSACCAKEKPPAPVQRKRKPPPASVPCKRKPPRAQCRAKEKPPLALLLRK
ncbi:hypothetical protein AMTRI_Chr02g263340 [Amborella trichopoda]